MSTDLHDYAEPKLRLAKLRQELLVGILHQALGVASIKEIQVILGVSAGTASALKHVKTEIPEGDFLAFARAQKITARLHPYLALDLPLQVYDCQALLEPPLEAAIANTIARAIKNRVALSISYLSRRGRRDLVISPGKLVFVLNRWHVRAYEHGDGSFKDLVLNRIEDARHVDVGFSSRRDVEWVDVELAFAPGPDLGDDMRALLEGEWKLPPDGVRRVRLPEPCASYVVRDMCRPMANGRTRWVPANDASARIAEGITSRVKHEV